MKGAFDTGVAGGLIRDLYLARLAGLSPYRET